MARKDGVWACDWCGVNPSPDAAQQVGDRAPLGWRMTGRGGIEWICGACGHELAVRQDEAYVLARMVRRK